MEKKPNTTSYRSWCWSCSLGSKHIGDWKSEKQEFHPRFTNTSISSVLAEMLLQTTAISTGSASLTSPFQAALCHSHYCCYSDKNLTQNSPFSLPKTVFLPRLGKWFQAGNRSRSSCHIGHFRAITPCATMLETPVLWAGRLCIFYALLKAGFAGSPTNPLISGSLSVSRFLIISRRKRLKLLTCLRSFSWRIFFLSAGNLIFMMFLVDLESGADDFGFYDWFQALSKPG